MSNRTTLARGKRRILAVAPNPLIAAWAKRQAPLTPARHHELFPPSAQVRRAARIRAAQAAAAAAAEEAKP